MESSSTSSSKNDWDRLKVLPRRFFARNTVEVAKDLLGKILIVKRGRGPISAIRIVETEAYRGDDPASHSSRGETPRCSVMFGHAGVAYVYFVYGMYEMLNFVTEPKGFPGAVLIRAGEPLAGESQMRKRRRVERHHNLTNGPGKLCRALGIEMSDNGAELSGPALMVIDDGFRPESISVSPRVGISEAKDVPWRFFITGNSFVSKTVLNKQSSPVRGARAKRSKQEVRAK